MASSRPHFGYRRSQVSNDLKENKYFNRRKLNAHMTVPEEPEVQEPHVVSPRSRLQRVRNFRESRDFKKVEIPMKKHQLKRTVSSNFRPPLSEENGIKNAKSFTKIPKPKAAFIPKGRPPVIKKPLKENNQPPLKGKKVVSSNTKGQKLDVDYNPGFPSDIISSVEPFSADTSFAPEGYTFYGVDNLSQFDFVCEDKSSDEKSLKNESTHIKKNLSTSISPVKGKLKDPKPPIKPTVPLANSKIVSNVAKTKCEPTKLRVPVIKKPVGGNSNTKLKPPTKPQANHEVNKAGAQLVRSKTKQCTPLSNALKIEPLSGNQSNKISFCKNKSDLSLNCTSSGEKSGKLDTQPKLNKSNDNVAKVGKHLDFKKHTNLKKAVEKPPEKVVPAILLDEEKNNGCVAIHLQKASESELSVKTDTDEVKTNLLVFSKSFSDLSLIEDEVFPDIPINLNDLDASLYAAFSPRRTSIICKAPKASFGKGKISLESFCSKFKELHVKSESKSTSTPFGSPSPNFSLLSDVFEANESSTKWQTESFHLENSTNVENAVLTEKDNVHFNNLNISVAKSELSAKDLILNEEIGCTSPINNNVVSLEEDLFHGETSLSVFGKTIDELCEYDENTDKNKQVTISKAGKLSQGTVNQNEITNAYGGMNIICEEIIQTNSNFNVVDGVSNSNALDDVLLSNIVNSDRDKPNAAINADCDSYYYQLTNTLAMSETHSNTIDISSIVNVVNPQVAADNSLCSISLLGSPPVPETPVTSLPDNLMYFSPSSA